MEARRRRKIYSKRASVNEVDAGRQRDRSCCRVLVSGGGAWAAIGHEDSGAANEGTRRWAQGMSASCRRD